MRCDSLRFMGANCLIVPLTILSVYYRYKEANVLSDENVINTKASEIITGMITLMYKYQSQDARAREFIET